MVVKLSLLNSVLHCRWEMSNLVGHYLCSNLVIHVSDSFTLPSNHLSSLANMFTLLSSIVRPE